MEEQVFISYSSLDRELALKIADDLGRNGINCWIDREGIRPGECYDDEIIAAIEQCPVFLLVLSENAENARYVPKELGLAINEDKKIIPLKISNFELKKFRLKLENIQILEWGRSWDRQRMSALADEIRAYLNHTPKSAMCPTIISQPAKPSPDRTRLTKIALAAGVAILLIASIFKLTQTLGPLQAGSDPSRFGASADASPENPQDTPDASPADAPPEYTPDTESGNSTSNSQSGKPVKLSTLNMMESQNVELRDILMSSTGHTFEDAVLLRSWSAWDQDNYVSYYLGGEYGWLTCTVCCPDLDVVSGEVYNFQIYLDGSEEEPVVEMSMGRTVPPTALVIDVSGAQSITFRVPHTHLADNLSALVADGLLYAAGSPAPAAPDVNPAPGQAKTKMSNMNMMETQNAELVDALMSSTGQTFENVIFLRSWSAWNEDNYVSYYLGGHYKQFTGTVCCPDQDVVSGETYTFQVYLDGNEDEPVLEMSMGRAVPPTPLEIDVSGAQYITFRIPHTHSAQNLSAFIADGLFLT